MNYYDLETHMWDRQRDLQHDAERRRLVALANARPDSEGSPTPRFAVLAMLAFGFRSLLARGRTSRIERPRLGDAS